MLTLLGHSPGKARVCSTRASWKRANPRDRRGIVQREVRKAEEESSHVKYAAKNKQGSWMSWEIVRERVLTWHDIWNMEEHRIKFLLCSIYDVLPSPTNLRRATAARTVEGQLILSMSSPRAGQVWQMVNFFGDITKF